MLRFGFVTCVQLGLSCMQTIYECGGRLDFAGTLHNDQATSKSGRVYLDDFCTRHSIPLHKFRNVNDSEALSVIAAASLDWLFIVGWSQIARRPVLEATRRGVLGMHPTLLPVGRGRAAVPWAILLGLPETGVTLFKLDEGVDTGPIVAQVRLPLEAREAASGLYRKVDQAHRQLIAENWNSLAQGRLQPVPQDESKATVWEGRTPDQGRLDPSMSVLAADRLVRAVTRPYPGAFIDVDGRRLRIWAAVPENSATEARRDLSARQLPSFLRFVDGTLAIQECQWEPISPTGT
jgi:methionyl-tRNA formyltransferase